MNISDILDHQKQFVCFQQDAERYVAEKHSRDFFEEGTEYSDYLLKDVESILKRVVLLFFHLAPLVSFSRVVEPDALMLYVRFQPLALAPRW